MKLPQFNFGIQAIGIALPKYTLDVRDLAVARQIDTDKFTIGLGCDHMAICGPGDQASSLGLRAAKSALDDAQISPQELGLLAVGTETAADISRPLSAFIADDLKLSGHIRSYEVKHACYGGTLALRQGLEWLECQNDPNAKALIIATDVAQYALASPGEPTQGAGAIALVLGKPELAAIAKPSIAYTKPVFDFWRPVGQPYPEVDGQLSVESYIECAQKVFGLWNQTFLHLPWMSHAQICFHTPFPKMVRKAFVAMANELNWDRTKTEDTYQQLVASSQSINKKVGNAYTASLWLQVANALPNIAPTQSILAFSYGSGCGSELLQLTKSSDQYDQDLANKLQSALNQQEKIDFETYVELRGSSNAD